MAQVEVCNGCREEVAPGTGIDLHSRVTGKKAVLCRRCTASSEVAYQVAPGSIVKQYLDTFINNKGDSG